MVERLKAPIRKRRQLRRELEMARASNIHVDEGHLGGYVKRSSELTASGLNIEHGDPKTYTPNLWRWAYDTLAVRSVLDVGCGEGHAAAFFQNLGCVIQGVDGSSEARRNSLIAEHHSVHDFVNGAFEAPRRYDLVWCCEFVEHVEAQYVANFLSAFRAASQYLMMTYAKPGQPGWHHVNCQPAEYWIELVEGSGFRFDQALTAESKQHAEPGHYRSRGLLFRRCA